MNKLILLLTLFLLVGILNAKEFEAKKLCNTEIKKEVIDVTVIKEQCSKTANLYESKNKYGIASWYYLLAGENDKNINEIALKIPKNKNFSNIAHSYILHNNLQKAKVNYLKFLKSYSAPLADDMIQDDYKLLFKLYPNNREQLQEGLRLWNKIYNPLLAVNELYLKYQKRKKEKNYQEAIKYLSNLIEIQKKSHLQSQLNIATNEYSLGTIFYYNHQYNEALRYYKQSLAIIKNILGNKHKNTISIYKDIGLTSYKLYKKYEKSKQYAEAIKYLAKTIDIQKIYLNKEHKLITKNLFQLGVLYNKNKEDKKALKILLKIEKKYKKNLYLLGWIASSYFNSKQYEKSLKFYKRSLLLSENKLDQYYIKASVTNVNIAYLYEKLKKYQKAIEHYQKALNISVKYNIANQDRILKYIADMYKYKVKNKESELFYRKKKFELGKKLYKKDNKKRIESEKDFLDLSCYYNANKKKMDLNITINTCLKLANFYEIHDDIKSALLPYLYSKKLNKVYKLSKNHFYEKALAYAIDGKIDKANFIYKNNPISKYEYNNLIKFYSVLKKIYPDQEEYLNKSLSDMIAIYKSSYPYSRILHTKYDKALKEKDYKKAVKYASEELKILSMLDNQKYGYYKGLVEEQLGELYYKLQKFEKSIKFLESSIKTYTSFIGIDHIKLTKIYERLATIYEEKSLHQKAIINFNKAIAIYMSQNKLENILFLQKSIKNDFIVNELIIPQNIKDTDFGISKPFVQSGHNNNYINKLDISDDENYLITAGRNDNNIILWDIRKGKQLKLFSGHTSMLMKIKLINNQYIASSAMNGTFIIWNIKNSKKIFNYKSFFSRLSHHFSITKDGKYFLFMSSENEITLFDLKNNKVIKKIDCKRNQKFYFINNDTKILIIDSRSIKIVDIKHNNISIKKKHFLNSSTINLLNENQFIYTKQYEDKIFIYDINKSKTIKSFNTKTGIIDLEFDYNSKYLITKNENRWLDRNQTYNIWDINTSKLLYTINKPKSSNVKLSKSGKIFVVTSPKDSKIYIYNVKACKLIKTIKYLQRINPKSFLANEKVVISSNYLNKNLTNLNVWNINKGKYTSKNILGHVKSLLQIDSEKNKILFLNNKNQIIKTDINLNINSKFKNDKLNKLPKNYLIKNDKYEKVMDIYKNMIVKRNYIEKNYTEGSISIVNIDTNKDIYKIFLFPNVSSTNYLKFFNHGKNILNASKYEIIRPTKFWISSSIEFNLIHLYDIKSKQNKKVFSGHEDTITNLIVNKQETKILSASEDGSIKLWNVQKSKLIKTFIGHQKNKKIKLLSFINNEKNIISGSTDGTVILWDIKSGKEIAKFISFLDGSWLCVTEEGYFNASKDVIKYLNITKSAKNNVSALDINQLYDHFFRPDLVKLKLAGKEKEYQKAIAGVSYEEALKNPPPKLSFTSINGKTTKMSGFKYDDINTSKEKVKLSFNVSEHDGGGVGLIRVYQEGKLIQTIGEGKINKQSANIDTLVEDAQKDILSKQQQSKYMLLASKSLTSDVNMSIEDTIAESKPVTTSNKAGTYSIEVELKSGKNEISIEAFNKTNTVTSYRENITINAAIPKHKPKLYTIVAGVNQFEAPNVNNLKYSENDAKAIKEAAEKQMGKIFSKVEVKYLIGKDVTKDNILKAAKEISKKARLEDTVLFYISTHGRAYKGKLYLVPYDNKKVKDWINFEQTFKAIQSIKALNQVFIIDACESGQANDIVSSVYDSRASVLAKSAGVHVLLATTKGTFAFEHPDKNIKHGVFTNRILQALKDKKTDTNKDSFISILELSKQLQEPTNNIEYQYPVIRNVGSDIKLESVK